MSDQTRQAEPMDGKAVVELKDVYKSFGSLHVLTGLNLGFENGKTTVVLGPSGTGKSVMLKVVVGLLKPDRGEVYYDGQRIDTYTEKQLADLRTEFGFLFQLGALFDSMTVGENIMFPLVEHSKMKASKQRERCSEVLDLVGLAGSEEKMPAELSGGQRKRIALARAIVLHPRVILYDEPTTGLDPIRSDVINQLIRKLQRELHVTSIVVTHDMQSAYTIADRIVMLYDGRIVADGTPEEIRQHPDPFVQSFIQGKATEQELASQGP